MGLHIVASVRINIWMVAGICHVRVTMPEDGYEKEKVLLVDEFELDSYIWKEFVSTNLIDNFTRRKKNTLVLGRSLQNILKRR